MLFFENNCVTLEFIEAERTSFQRPSSTVWYHLQGHGAGLFPALYPGNEQTWFARVDHPNADMF